MGSRIPPLTGEAALNHPRRRILFVSEAATLAHLARPYALARSLDELAWEVIFACNDAYLRLFPEWPWPREPIQSIDPQLFAARLAKGARLYPSSTLRQYIHEDLKLLEHVQPDVVVGDFRLSLSVSARVARIPYLALGNAYWSPFASQTRVPVPCLPMTRLVGVPLAGALFSMARPLAFAWHTLPLNRLRAEYGLPTLGTDLRRVYTDADITLYADVPELVPTHQLPSNHRYIGPIEWSPALPMPELLTRDADCPLVYVTMGSSGSGGLLPQILKALSALPCQVAVASAGVEISDIPSNTVVTDYLPGDAMSARARLVVCNGGSPTSHQALARGVPVLGMPFNLDQHLNMQYVADYGAGIALRPEHATVSAIRDAAAGLLTGSHYKLKAERLATVFRTYHPGQLLAQAAVDALETRA